MATIACVCQVHVYSLFYSIVVGRRPRPRSEHNGIASQPSSRDSSTTEGRVSRFSCPRSPEAGRHHNFCKLSEIKGYEVFRAVSMAHFRGQSTVHDHVGHFLLFSREEKRSTEYIQCCNPESCDQRPRVLSLARGCRLCRRD